MEKKYSISHPIQNPLDLYLIPFSPASGGVSTGIESIGDCSEDFSTGVKILHHRDQIRRRLPLLLLGVLRSLQSLPFGPLEV